MKATKYKIASLEDAKRVAEDLGITRKINNINDLVTAIFQGGIKNDTGKNFTIEVKDPTGKAPELVTYSGPAGVPDIPAPLSTHPFDNVMQAPVEQNSSQATFAEMSNLMSNVDWVTGLTPDNMNERLTEAVKSIRVHPNSCYTSLDLNAVTDMVTDLHILPINEPYANAYAQAVLIHDDVKAIRDGLKMLDQGISLLACDVINGRFMAATEVREDCRKMMVTLLDEQ